MTFQELKDKQRKNIKLGGLTRLLKEKRKLMKTMTSEEAENFLIKNYKD